MRKPYFDPYKMLFHALLGRPMALHNFVGLQRSGTKDCVHSHQLDAFLIRGPFKQETVQRSKPRNGTWQIKHFHVRT